MNHSLITIVVLGLTVSTSTIAGQTEYDDCILKNLKGAKLDLAAHLIKQACEKNYKSSTFTSDKNRAYYNCLLEHLIEVESIQAIMDIKTSCANKHK